MLKGNKGEWSELYVLISLLADGQLYQSDINLDKDPNNLYKVIKGYKDEKDYSLEFDRGNQVNLYRIQNNQQTLISSYTFSELRDIANTLYNGITSGKGNSFEILAVAGFLENAAIQKLKANSSVKSDIRLRVYDHRLAHETDLGFSIKSLLGGNSTLFNTGPGNNFIYSGMNMLSESITDFNKRTYSAPKRISKLTYRIQELEKAGIILDFQDIQSNQLWKNLKMVDGDLPKIIGWALYFRWRNREPSLKKIAQILEDEDPLNFYNNKYSVQKLYEYKLKRFLTEAAMGMTSETPWVGEYDSFGGVIVAKSDGDILCFHIYDFNIFRNYLINNTIFEQPSTGEDKNNPGSPGLGKKKYFYGWIYEENSNLNLKLNLQIRFA
ncbi:MAG: HpaII family restriction endonuclease [Leeuwenhoekiella sp.]